MFSGCQNGCDSAVIHQKIGQHVIQPSLSLGIWQGLWLPKMMQTLASKNIRTKNPVFHEIEGCTFTSLHCICSPSGPDQLTYRTNNWFSYVGFIPHPSLQKPAPLQPLFPTFKREGPKDLPLQVPLKQPPPYKINREVFPRHLPEC